MTQVKRHWEWKFIVYESILSSIRKWLASRAHLDLFASETGRYQVKTGYLSSIRTENNIGPLKCKFRLRKYFSGDADVTSVLEVKTNCIHRVTKARSFLQHDNDGNWDVIISSKRVQDLARKAGVDHRLHIINAELTKKILVEYEREAWFLYGAENIRLTFDFNVVARNLVFDSEKEVMFPEPITTSVLPSQYIIMEIKCPFQAVTIFDYLNYLGLRPKGISKLKMAQCAIAEGRRRCLERNNYSGIQANRMGI